jgi:hypothetical protein
MMMDMFTLKQTADDLARDDSYMIEEWLITVTLQ